MNPTRTFRLRYDDEPGRAIRGTVDLPPGLEPGERRPVVFVVHGFKGFGDWGFFPLAARRIVEAGFVSVRFDMSGSGILEDPSTFEDEEGFARNTVSRELEDLERVRTWALARDGGGPGVPEADPARAGALGHSMGGGVVLLHAALHPEAWRALVTWAAVARFDRFDAETLARWRAEGSIRIPNARTKQTHRLDRSWLDDLEANAARLDVPAACARLAVPTLLLHGSEDASVPPDEGRRLAAALPAGVGRLELLEGAGHTFGARHPLPADWLEAPVGERAGRLPDELERVLARTLEHLERHLRG